MDIQYCIFMLLWFIQQGNTQQCVVSWSNGTEWDEKETGFGVSLPSILDTDEPGKLLLVLNTTNIIKISNVMYNSNSGRPYMNASIAMTTTHEIFKLTLTDDFTNYEKYETEIAMDITVEFSCISGKKLKINILQPITDTNNHAPEFVNAPYYYRLSMPFPKNFAIDLFGEIIVRDIDLTNKNVSFSLNKSDPLSEDFTVHWLSSAIKHDYARLITKRVLNFDTDVTFHLIATDSGYPPISTKTAVTISIDKANSILRFSQPIYIADYTKLEPEKANGTKLSFEEGEIFLRSGINDVITYSLNENSGEYLENFKLDVSSDYSRVQLILIDPPDIFFNESFVLLTLTAKKPGEKETALLHISLPGRLTSKIFETTQSSISTSITTARDFQNRNNFCDCTNCEVAVFVLSTLLIGITIGLITFIIITWKQPKRDTKALKNGSTVQVEQSEMTETYKDSNGITPVETSQRSVAFNDTIEEINASRL